MPMQSAVDREDVLARAKNVKWQEGQSDGLALLGKEVGQTNRRQKASTKIPSETIFWGWWCLVPGRTVRVLDHLLRAACSKYSPPRLPARLAVHHSLL